MFVSDIKRGFYDIVVSSRVLLLVGSDVDALCSCKILQHLFQCDHVLYTLVPVYDKSSLVEAFKKHGNQVKYVILVNCGSTIDIVDTLQPQEEVIFFVADSHRPVDVYNVYNDSQVRLLMKPDEENEVPSYENIFREDEEENEESEEEDPELDRQERFEKKMMKRRERRLWEENRHKIMFDYTQFSYYGPATSLLLFDLAWKLSKDTNVLLWWAIVGLADQYVHNKIEQDKYVLSAGSLQNHVSRHNHRGEGEDNIMSINCLQINFEKELQLALYRHWTLYESLKHTRSTACKFRIWSLNGQRKLFEFLAEIGLPLVQCKQKYSAMDIQLKSNISEWLEAMSEKYKLDRIVYGSFTAHYGFKNKLSASDVVYSAGALLESVDKEKSNSEKFLDALDSLSWNSFSILEKGIDQAKCQLIAIFQTVQSFLDMNYVICAGPFLYAVIQEGTPDVKYFNYPTALTMLAQFLLHAHVASARNRKTRSLPLVLMAPHTTDGEISLVIGIPPISEDSKKNFFGKAFEQASERSKCVVIQDYFEQSVIQLKNEDRSKFFDSLISLLS